MAEAIGEVVVEAIRVKGHWTPNQARDLRAFCQVDWRHSPERREERDRVPLRCGQEDQEEEQGSG